MKKVGLYVLNFILSLLFHWYWSVPAWILLALHFTSGISIWWFIGALALYVIGVRLFVHVVGWLIRAGNSEEPETKNKNPYSAGQREKTEYDIR